MNAAPAQRIIHVPRRFVREEWGGTETVVLEVAREQLRAGWQPEIVTSLALAGKRVETIGGVPVRRFGYRYPFFGLTDAEKRTMDKKGGNLFSLSLFLHLLARPNVRLFHAHALKRLGGEVRTAARWRRLPFVVTLHGGVFDVPESEREQLLRLGRQRIEWGKALGAVLGSRRLLADADLVICVGQSEFEKARAQIGHERISHLPNGVNPAKFAGGDGRRFRRAHGIPATAFLVLNISRIDTQKNQDLLVRAFAGLQRRRPDCRLVLVGPVTEPDYETRLRALIETRGLAQSVQLLPALPYDDPALADAYAAADLFVLPSIHEPFGIVVLETWSCRKAVLVSRVGGLRHLVRADQTGVFFDPTAPQAEAELAARLEQLAAQPEWRTELGRAGRQEVETTYDWRIIAARLETLYQAAEQHARR